MDTAGSNITAAAIKTDCNAKSRCETADNYNTGAGEHAEV